MEIHAVVLAGGFGTRLQRVVKDLPKPMVAVAGRPFIEWVLLYLFRAGIRSATLATGYLGDRIASHFASNPLPGLEIDCVRESSPLGTGGAFVEAVKATGRKPDAWLVVNGDSIIFADLPALFARLTTSDLFDAVISAREVDHADRYGRLIMDELGNLKHFLEKSTATSSAGLINAGVYLFRRQTLERFPKRLPLSFEFDIFPELLRLGSHIALEVSDAPFCDIGTEESLAGADMFIRDNLNRLS